MGGCRSGRVLDPRAYLVKIVTGQALNRLRSEVFDMPYDEIAEAVGKTSAAVRRIAHRARQHVATRRPRTQVHWAEQQMVVERFLVAIRTGDRQSLLDVMAPDVALVSDGGGVTAAPRPRSRGCAAWSLSSRPSPSSHPRWR